MGVNAPTLKLDYFNVCGCAHPEHSIDCVVVRRQVVPPIAAMMLRAKRGARRRAQRITVITAKDSVPA